MSFQTGRYKLLFRIVVTLKHALRVLSELKLFISIRVIKKTLQMYFQTFEIKIVQIKYNSTNIKLLT